MKDYEGIEVGKMWKEYSDMERSVLPQIPLSEQSKSNPPFMWNGFFWEYVLID